MMVMTSPFLKARSSGEDPGKLYKAITSVPSFHISGGTEFYKNIKHFIPLTRTNETAIFV